MIGSISTNLLLKLACFPIFWTVKVQEQQVLQKFYLVLLCCSKSLRKIVFVGANYNANTSVHVWKHGVMYASLAVNAILYQLFIVPFWVRIVRYMPMENFSFIETLTSSFILQLYDLCNCAVCVTDYDAFMGRIPKKA